MFAFIALFVACFVIYNVFSITVAQRQRENALIRAIGASRRQVIGSMLVESVVVGLVGSLLGLGLGMLLAMGLQRAFSALGIDLPVDRPRAAPAHDRSSRIVVGLIVTVLSALVPACAPVGCRRWRRCATPRSKARRHQGSDDRRARSAGLERRC